MKKSVLSILALLLALLLTACNSNENSNENSNRTPTECVHDYGRWSVTKTATCTTEGIQSRECTKCGLTETNNLPSLGHTEIVDSAINATCTSDGLTEGKHCSTCNTVIVAQQSIPSSHSYDNGVITQQSTCTAKGIKTFTCSGCGGTKTESVNPTGHKYDKGVVTKQATCSSEGVKTFTCTTCHEIKNSTISKTDHNYDSGSYKSQPTCEKNGVKAFKCRDCGYERTSTVSKLGHQPNADFVCTRCGKQLPVSLNMTASEKTAANSVQWLSDRSVQHSANDKTQTLLFSLKDSSETRIKAPAVVDIRIVNNAGVTVYQKTRIVKTTDFGTWTSSAYGERLLASVVIKDSDITPGTTEEGKIYFTIYNEGYFSFSESTLDIDDLPLKATKVILPDLPTTLHDYSYSGSIQSSVKITSITYEISGDSIYFYFSGQKTYDAKGSNFSQSAKIGWKLYDSDGFIVDSGTCYTPNLATGEKFRNVKDYAFSVLSPGETYTLVISNVE